MQDINTDLGRYAGKQPSPIRLLITMFPACLLALTAPYSLLVYTPLRLIRKLPSLAYLASFCLSMSLHCALFFACLLLFITRLPARIYYPAVCSYLLPVRLPSLRSHCALTALYFLHACLPLLRTILFLSVCLPVCMPPLRYIPCLPACPYCALFLACLPVCMPPLRPIPCLPACPPAPISYLLVCMPPLRPKPRQSAW